MRWLVWMAYALLSGHAQFEGYSKVPYPDPVGITTVCHGHRITHDDKFKDYDWQRCEILKVADEAKSAAAVYRCAKPVTLGQFLAFDDLAYNVGRGAFCRSSPARLSRKGKLPESCRALEKYVYADGKRLKGLVKRRAYYSHLCRHLTWPG